MEEFFRRFFSEWPFFRNTLIVLLCLVLVVWYLSDPYGFKVTMNDLFYTILGIIFVVFALRYVLGGKRGH